MSGHRELPFIAQTVTVIAEHCPEEIEAILSEAERRVEAWEADPLSSRRPVAQCSGPTSADDELWTELWVELARRHPALFGPELAQLSEKPRGPSLAWLYVRHQHPDQLIEGASADAGGKALCARLCAEIVPALATLADDGVLATVQPHLWRVTPECVLDAYLNHNHWWGINLFCEPALRFDTFLSSTSMLYLTDQPPSKDLSLALLLHEHIHVALTHAAMPGRAVKLGPLRVALNEAVVEVLACYAASFAFGEPAPAVLVRARYPLAVLTFLALLPELREADIPRLAAFGRANLQAESDDAAAQLLNSLAGQTRSSDGWLCAFTSPESSVEVRLSSPEVSVHALYANGHCERHYDYADDNGEHVIEEHFQDLPLRLHREHGPAVVVDGPNGYTAWYRDGQLHRESDPAVEWNCGGREWRINGELDREDGPAVEEADYKAWYHNDELHREDGPALVVLPGGNVEVVDDDIAEPVEVAGPAQLYFENGLLHRPAEAGPALIAGEHSERQEYWEHGKRVAPPKPRRMSPATKTRP